MGVRQVGDWDKASRILRKYSGGALARAMNNAVKQEAEEFRKVVVQGIRKGQPKGGKKFTPLRPLTVGRKKSNKPLIDRGTLFRAIRVKRVRPNEYFVGVHRTARSKKSGKGLANIAAVHENGAVISIKVTPKMVRAFFAMLRKAGDNLANAAGSARRARTKRGRQRAQARLPSGGSARGKVSGGSFTPGSVIVIRIPPRPFLGPPFKVFRKAGKTCMAARIARLTLGELGRVAGGMLRRR